jgi:hypothetical protein
MMQSGEALLMTALEAAVPLWINRSNDHDAGDLIDAAR